MAAQVTHAAGESACGPLPPNTHAVVLAASSQEELEAIGARLRGAGVEHQAIVEDVGEFAGQLCAIGLRPKPREEVYRLLSSLPLLR